MRTEVAKVLRNLESPQIEPPRDEAYWIKALVQREKPSDDSVRGLLDGPDSHINAI